MLSSSSPPMSGASNGWGASVTSNGTPMSSPPPSNSSMRDVKRAIAGSASPSSVIPQMSVSNVINVSYEKFAPRASNQVSRLSRIAALTAGPIATAAAASSSGQQQIAENNGNSGDGSSNFLLRSLLYSPTSTNNTQKDNALMAIAEENKSSAEDDNLANDLVQSTIDDAFVTNDACASIYKHTTKLRLALRASMNIAEDISNRHTELIRHSSELSAAADRLQEEEHMLAKHAEEIGKPLKHYDSVDELGISVGVLFKGLKNSVVRGLPKIKVDHDEFPKVLDAIDDAVIFFGRESGGKDALEQYQKDQQKKAKAAASDNGGSAGQSQLISGSIEYYRRALILQEAALDLIKEAVVDRIQNTTDQICNILNIPKQVIQADKLEASLIYTRYYGISKRSNALLGFLKARLYHGDAYTELLTLCKSTYCKNRETLLKATVTQHIEKLKKQHGLVGMTRLASVFLVRLCTIETNLYLEFFGDTKQEQEEEKEQNGTTPSKTPTSASKKTTTSKNEEFIYDTLFQNYLTNLCNCMHRVIRKGLVSLTDLDILCQIISILREERTSASAVSVTLSAARAISNVIEDTQERLIFISNSTLTKEIIKFKPTKKDLDYPNKLIKKEDNGNTADAAGKDNKNDSDEIEKQLLLVYESWYPPMRSVLKILSKIFRVVEPHVFEDIALQSVQACTKCLKDGALYIYKTNGQIHSDLFLVKHLLILREQLSPFDIELRSVERQLDFSDAGAAVARFLANSNRRLFSINSNENALLTLLREGVSINETSIDSKRDLEDALRVACNDFIDHTTGQIVAIDLMKLYNDHRIQIKVATSLPSNKDIDDNNNTSNNATNPADAISIETNALTTEMLLNVMITTMQGNPNVEQDADATAINIEYLQSNFNKVLEQMGLYLDNPITQNILLKPIIRKMLKTIDEIRKYVLTLQSMILIEIQNNPEMDVSIQQSSYYGFHDKTQVDRVFTIMKKLEKSIKSIKANSTNM